MSKIVKYKCKECGFEHTMEFAEGTKPFIETTCGSMFGGSDKVCPSLMRGSDFKSSKIVKIENGRNENKKS